MMIGELDFGDIFHSQNYLATENTLADGEEDFFLTSVFYEGVTYTIFLLFLIIMSILIMNLLVRLEIIRKQMWRVRKNKNVKDIRRKWRKGTE